MANWIDATNQELLEELRKKNTPEAETTARIFEYLIESQSDETVYMLKYEVELPPPEEKVKARREVWAITEKQARAKLEAELTGEFPSAVLITVFPRKKTVSA